MSTLVVYVSHELFECTSILTKGSIMKAWQVQLVLLFATAFVAACASTPPPVVERPAPTPGTAPLAIAPALVTPTMPGWYVKQPDSTPEFVYVAGAAISRDMAMSNHKAQLDAETHLANKIAGEINTLTKDYKRDVGDEFVQSTEIVANKIATDVRVIGGVVVDRQIFPEGGGYRTYVLLKFPLGTNNQMLQSYQNRKSLKVSKAIAERELDVRRKDRQEREQSEDKGPIVRSANTIGQAIRGAQYNTGNPIDEPLAATRAAIEKTKSSQY